MQLRSLGKGRWNCPIERRGKDICSWCLNDSNSNANQKELSTTKLRQGCCTNIVWFLIHFKLLSLYPNNAEDPKGTSLHSLKKVWRWFLYILGRILSCSSTDVAQRCACSSTSTGTLFNGCIGTCVTDCTIKFAPFPVPGFNAWHMYLCGHNFTLTPAQTGFYSL